MGSTVGTTRDDGILCMRRRGTVLHPSKNFKFKDVQKGRQCWCSVPADVYVKLNGNDFKFVLEEDNFKSDDNFIPRIWEHHDGRMSIGYTMWCLRCETTGATM